MELVPNLAGQVTLTGNDLTVTSPEVPAVKLPVLQKYQWITQPLTVMAAVLNPAVTTKLNVYLLKGGLQSALQQISQQVAPLLSAKPAADGSVAPVTIDPATLADGIYTLAGFGLGQNENIGGMALRLLVVDKAPVFSDVPATQWARQWVDALSYLGVVNGRGAGTFAPGAEVTRAEFAKMLALAIGLKPASGNDFADVPDDWSRPYIEALYQAKLVTGEMANGQRYFYPTRSISRAEAATIIGRSQGVTDGAYTVGNTGFTDFNQVPTWAQHAVVVLTQRLLITGFPDNTFRPLQTLHRDQAAKILGGVVGIGQ
ncbi:MAG: S-layer homology domain-containing protein [Mycobacterium leprae]